MKRKKLPTICIVHPYSADGTETFVQAQIDNLPEKIIEVSIDSPGFISELRIIGLPFLHRAIRKFRAEIGLPPYDTNFFARYLKRNKVALVLAHYGPSAVLCLSACLRAGVPIVPHFHGFDASKETILERYRLGYNRLFEECPAIIAVSKSMIDDLVAMNAPRSKIHKITCGVDTRLFNPTKPEDNPPHFLGIGRFVEKKAPFITILAFESLLKECPNARLTIAGDGHLLDACKTLINALGIAYAVDLPGRVTQQQVSLLMRRSRAFVQHSVRAPDGDKEGTPVSILEAGASGLPVVATLHAGIPEVVSHEETGLLSKEQDIQGMSRNMITFAKDSEYAANLGRNARKKIEDNFALTTQIDKLASLLHSIID